MPSAQRTQEDASPQLSLAPVHSRLGLIDPAAAPVGRELFAAARLAERRRRSRPIFVDFDDGAQSACGPALVVELAAGGWLTRARHLGEQKRVLIRRWRREGARAPWPTVDQLFCELGLVGVYRAFEGVWMREPARGPKQCPELHDPFSVLSGGTNPAIMLIDGRPEAAVAALHQLVPYRRAIGLRGRMTAAAADEIVGASTEPVTVYLWVAPEARRSAVEHLHAAGVEDVLVVSTDDPQDYPPDILERLGRPRAAARMRGLLFQTESDGAVPRKGGADA